MNDVRIVKRHVALTLEMQDMADEVFLDWSAQLEQWIEELPVVEKATLVSFTKQRFLETVRIEKP